MRNRMIVTTIALFAAILHGDVAQAQDYPNWPPDPKTLFAPGIEVLQTKEIVPVAPPAPTQTRCGRLVLANDPQVALIEKDDQFFICDLATGKLSQPMPIQYNWYYAQQKLDGFQISTSPDGKWAWYINETDTGAYLLSYERATGKLLRLGQIPHEASYNQQFGWASNTDLYFTSRDMPEWSITYAYVANVAVADSLKLVMTNQRWSVDYFDNPPRFERWLTPSNDELGHQDGQPYYDCTLAVYRFSDHSTTIYHTGNLCTPEYGDELGNGYYLDVQADGLDWMVRFNPATRQLVHLYHGEIEHIYWVSADEHYALVDVDDNAKVDCKPGYEGAGFMPSCWAESHPTMTLIDVKTGEIVYHTSGDADTIPLDDRTLAVTLSIPLGSNTFKSVYLLLRFRAGKVCIETLPGNPLLVLDATHLVAAIDYSGISFALVDYDIDTHAIAPITNPSPDFRIHVNKVQSDQVTLDVFPSSAYGYDNPQIEYTVKITSSAGRLTF